MTAKQIKSLVDQGKAVHWLSPQYRVIKNNAHDYVIECQLNGHCIGLTWSDGETLNGQPDDFYYINTCGAIVRP